MKDANIMLGATVSAVKCIFQPTLKSKMSKRKAVHFLTEHVIC